MFLCVSFARSLCCCAVLMSFLVVQSGCSTLLSCDCWYCILYFFFTVPWAGLQYVIVPFSDHTHLLYEHISDFFFYNIVGALVLSCVAILLIGQVFTDPKLLPLAFPYRKISMLINYLF